MDDFVAFPEMLDLAPFMAPNRNDYKLVPTPGGGSKAPYMDWVSPADGPELDPVMYRLYGISTSHFYQIQANAEVDSCCYTPRNDDWGSLCCLLFS